MSTPYAYVTRVESFSAAHRLSRDDWDYAQNEKCFGLCANPNGHGHNYKVEVTVKGKVNEDDAMVVAFDVLKQSIQSVLRILDHKNLNKDIEYFKNKITTTENVSVFIWESLKKLLPVEVELHEIRVSSTDKNSVTFRGEYV